MERRIIDISGKFLSGLEKAQAVTSWAVENKGIFERHLEGFNELITFLNNIPRGSSLLNIMPKTRVLKDVLNGEPLPTLGAMAPGNFANALREARDPMLHGQSIKKREIVDPTPQEKAFAIGTSSMETTPEALAVGTAGHLAERTFFQWARGKGRLPKNGWKKDDWLQALDEGLMLMLFEGKIPHLTPFFIQSNDKGGLGWLNEQKLEDFHSKFVSLFKTKTRRVASQTSVN
jgi:hypothetical protein